MGKRLLLDSADVGRLDHMWVGARAGILVVSLCTITEFTATQRTDAFVGYNEDPTLDNARARCNNKEDQCATWQKNGQCLANPYYMRVRCAQSCSIPSCVGYQKHMSPWKGYATEYHTKQYATRYTACLPFLYCPSEALACTHVMHTMLLTACNSFEQHLTAVGPWPS